MKLLQFLGLQKKNKTGDTYPYQDILHLWEDDSLMIELLPCDNLDFIKSETSRINNFGEQHFDGNGFTDITPVGEKPVRTIEKKINIKEVEKILTNAGLGKIEKFIMEGVGLLQGDKAPLGFGTNEFAIICNKENGLLKHISITGHTRTENDRQNLSNALSVFGLTYKFVAVDWYKCKYYSLVDKNNLDDFIKNSC